MKYNWLEEEKSPRILVQAIKLIGTKEIVGKAHNPIILDWARELGLKMYTNDEIRNIMFQCLTAIEYVHRNGFAHRDIKPENFLVKHLSPDLNDKTK